MASTPQSKLIECREMLFGASQSLYLIAGVLRDREMLSTADGVGDLASMLSEFSISIDPLAEKSA